MEVSDGLGPVSDRDAPADGSADRRTGQDPRRASQLALQAAQALPPRGPFWARGPLSTAASQPDAATGPLRGRDRHLTKGSPGLRRRRRGRDHPLSPPKAPRRGRPIVLHHLAGAQGPGLRHSSAPETTQEFAPALQCGPPQRDLAGRRNPCRGRRGRGVRGAQHHRRPFKAVCRLAGVRHHQVVRRRAHVLQIGRNTGLSPVLPH